MSGILELIAQIFGGAIGRAIAPPGVLVVRFADQDSGDAGDRRTVAELRQLFTALPANAPARLRNCDVAGGQAYFEFDGQDADAIEQVVRLALNGRALRPGSHLLKRIVGDRGTGEVRVLL